MLGKAKSVNYTVASVDYARKLNLEDAKKGIIVDTNRIIGETGAEVFKEFKIFQDLNGRCENNTLSIVISPFPQDSKQLTNEQWAELSREVLKRMGLEHHQSITIKHPHDTHNHLHIYVNRIDMQGFAYKDNFISKKIQTVCDAVAIDLNFTRAKEVEIANQIIKQPTLDKIRKAYSKVISDPKTNYNNVFSKLEHQGLQITFNKEQLGKKDGYTIALHGIQFKASEIDKAYSYQQLKSTIEQPQSGLKRSTKDTPKEKIQKIFAETMVEKGITPQSFLTRVAEKGVEIQPTINSQGNVQGYRAVLDGESYKASEIGNKYTLAKLEQTFKNEAGKANIGFQNSLQNKPILQDKLCSIISDVILEKDTTKENFIHKIGENGVTVWPIKNDKGELTNFTIGFDNSTVLATDVCLKYTLQNPERLIAETRKIQQKEKQLTISTELSHDNKLDTIESFKNKNQYPNNSNNLKMDKNMKSKEHPSYELDNSKQNDANQAIGQLFESPLDNLFIPTSMLSSNDDEEESQERWRKRKLKRRRNNGLKG